MVWLAALGCTHLDARGGTRFASAPDTDTTQAERERSEPDGRVDVSEPPSVEYERGFWPGSMASESEPQSWLTADFTGPVTNIDLRNGCRRSLDFVFAPTGEAGSAGQPPLSLDAYTMQTQVIPSGYWLHLYDGGRWLGAAVVSVSAGTMEVSPDCETLDVSYELRERGITHFAIHWQLDAESSSAPAPAPALTELALEQVDGPESWAPGEGQGIELRLANSCAEPLDYAFTPTLDEPPARRSTLPAHTERIVEVPPGWWLQHQVRDGGDDGWAGGVTTNHAGDVLWLSANCIDHGVGDGRVVHPGNGGLNVE